MAEGLLRVMRREIRAAAVLALAGEIDLSVSPGLREQLWELAAAPETPELVVLDLREVRFCDCSGLGALVGGRQRLVQSGRELALVVGETSLLRRLLRLTQLDEAFPVRGTVESALATGLDKRP